jgi:hypothetical protein
MNGDCYNFVLYEENANVLDSLWTENQVEATYVIYLEGNEKRYEQIMEQLKLLRPTDNIWILHNQGFKECHKEDVFIPPEDVIDANYTVFKHANDHGYKNILILEDDFLFDDRLLNYNTSDPSNPPPHQEIGKFVEDWNKVTPFIPFVYYLGTLPLIQCPIGWSHNLALVTCGAHAVIYNRALRDKILSTPQNKLKDWDIYINQLFPGTRYTYRIPLCYQLFPNTTNSDYWGYEHPKLHWLANKFHLLNSKFLNLDKKVEPGYSLYNLVSKLLFLFLFLFVIYIIWNITYWISNFIKIIFHSNKIKNKK